jgi:hypothetical protein
MVQPMSPAAGHKIVTPAIAVKVFVRTARLVFDVISLRTATRLSVTSTHFLVATARTNMPTIMFVQEISNASQNAALL